MKITNKDVIQSYILTTAKYDYSVYEKRILYRLIEFFQSLTTGEKLNYKIQLTKDLFDVSIVTMPISLFLNGEDDKNHVRVKEAIRSLESKRFEYEDDRTWQIIRIISEPKLDKFEANVSFRINPKVVQAFLDFSKGFKKYELKTAMTFESVYSMRFYELLSGQRSPIEFSIDKLKLMFQLQDKYSQPADFIKRVVAVAKKELDKKAPYSFEYKVNKLGRSMHSITFYPVYNPDNRDPQLEQNELQKKSSISWDLDRLTVSYLKENYYFTDQEIKNNIDVFKAAQASKSMDLLYFLSENKRKAANKKNPKGWIINAIKKALQAS